MNVDFARNQMVQQQARAWDVFDDRVLDVLRDVPRESFVAPAYKALAFADVEIPLGHGEFMMTPTLEGRVLQALALSPDDRVLEIGTGSGFLTACLSVLAKDVVSIDIRDDFLHAAEDRLSALKIQNVTLAEMDAMQALPDGQFDAIAITGSLEHFAPRFIESLSDDGRLFAVIGESPAMDARLITRSASNAWHSDNLFETDLRPLTNGQLPEQFEF